MPQVIVPVLAAGAGIYSASKQASSAKKAANEQQAQNEAAQRAAQEASVKAKSQAEESRRAFMANKARSQTVMTSPLGISGQAQVAKKQLLGQ